MADRCRDLEDAPAGYRCIDIGPVAVEWDVEAGALKLPADDDFYSIWIETPAQAEDLIEAFKVAIAWFPKAGQ